MVTPDRPRPAQSRTAVAGFVLLGLGVLALVVSFTSMNWLSGESGQQDLGAKFGDVGEALSRSKVGGLAGAYFGPLAWILLIVAAVLVGASNIPARGQNAWRALGVVACLAGVALTVGAVNDLGVAYSIVSAGFWVAIIGFVVLGAGALIPSRPIVTYLANYGMPTDQQKFAQPHQLSPGVMPGMPLGSTPPPQFTYSQPASAPSPAQSPATLVAAGWMTDPARRYELRYWDGTRWTESVSTNGSQSVDPL